MKKVSCTRMELLAINAKISLARQGYDLLEKKRSALLKEVLKTVDIVIEHAESLEQTASTARKTLARAERAAGAEAVNSAALAGKAELSIQVKSANIMGVKVPHIEQKKVSRPVLDRGYAVTDTSVTIDETAEAFENQVIDILSLAESELRLKRLSEAIYHTNRRLNALEHLLIPEMEEERRIIQQALDERERTDHFRQVLMKRNRMHHRARRTGSP